MRRNLNFYFRGTTVASAALIIGSVFSLAGTAAAPFYVSPIASHVQTTTQALDNTWARLKIIRSANAIFALLQSFDGLVHLVPADFSANPSGADAVYEIGTRAIHDRHQAVRNYFAQAAAAGEIDYRDIMQRYDTLIAAETRDWNLKTYSATNALPAEVNMKVATDRWNLEKSAIQLRGDLFQSLMERDRRAWLQTLLAAAGASILFVLALLKASERSVAARPTAEMSRAQTLMSLALLETRRRIADSRPGEAGPL